MPRGGRFPGRLDLLSGEHRQRDRFSARDLLSASHLAQRFAGHSSNGPHSRMVGYGVVRR